MTLKGIAVPWGAPPVVIPGGYALTPDVDKNFWDEWLRLYNTMDIVEKGIIFAMPKPQEARAKAREFVDVKTGLEPLDPEKPGNGLEPLKV